MPISENQVLDALRQVKYPGFSRDIISFGIVKNVALEDQRCAVAMELAVSDPKIADHIKTESEKALSALGFQNVLVSIHVKPVAVPSFQHQPVEGIKYVIAVASGKGGVGKSTVSVNLSMALSKLGARVGLLDCDVYGPSVPLMMNATQSPQVEQERLIPVESHGIKLMSMGFLIDPDSAVVWRGPMVTRTIQQFLHQVSWGELDYLIIDLPPGTGDAQLTLCQTIPLTGAVVVTTPQEVALLDVRKAVTMFQKVNVTILGIIENMSYFLCPDNGKRYEIFGSGGGQREADRLAVPLFGKIPIEMAVREGGDRGMPIVISHPDSPSSQAFMATAETLRKLYP